MDLFIQQLEQKGDLAYYESIKLVQLNIDKDEYLTLKKQAKSQHKKETVDFVLLCMMPRMKPSEVTIATISDIYDEIFNNENL